MFNDWYRQHNFFKKLPDYYSATNRVAFKNCAPLITIKSIDVIREKDQQINIYIEATAFHADEVHDVVKKYFGAFCVRPFKYISLISFKPSDDLQLQIIQLKEMFNYLNKKYQRIEFTDILLKELANILSWVSLAPTLNNVPCHIIEEYRIDISGNVIQGNHINPLKQKSLAILELFTDENSKYIKDNLLSIRKKFRDLLRNGEDPNQTNEQGDFPLKFAILYLTSEDVAYLLWYKADPRYRPKGTTYYSDNAIELTKIFNKPEHFNIMMASAPRKSLSSPRLQVKSIKTTANDTQIITDLVFTNNRSIKTRFITTEEFHKPDFATLKSAIFKLFLDHFSDINGDIKKTKENFDKEFSAEKNKNIDIIFDNEEQRVVGFVLIRIVDDRDILVVKFEYMAVAADSLLRNCGGVGLFAIRWGCLIKGMYSSSIVKTYYLASDYNSYCPMQDELTTPKYLSKWMLESNQRLIDLEFGRKVPIYYGRFIAIQSLLKVTDKKGPNRKLTFDEFCYNNFILIYDSPEDKKLILEKMGGEPVQAAVVSSVIGARFLKRRAQLFKTFLNIDLNEHVCDLGSVFKHKTNTFMPLLKHHKQTALSLKLEDENLTFYTGVQRSSKL